MRKGLTIFDIIGVMVILGFMVFVFWPIISPHKNHGTARQTTCLSNQKQIALAFGMFVQDNDEKMPVVNNSVFSTIGLSGKVLNCPNTEGQGYVVNAVLSKLSLDQIESPTSIWLTADARKGATGPIGYTGADMDNRHADGILSSYFDGHAAYSKTIAFVTDNTSVAHQKVNSIYKAWNDETKVLAPKNKTGRSTVVLEYRYKDIKASTANNTENTQGLRPITGDLLLPTRAFGGVIKNFKYSLNKNNVVDHVNIDLEYYICTPDNKTRIKIGKTFMETISGVQLIGKDFYIYPVAVVPSWDELRTMKNNPHDDLYLTAVLTVTISSATSGVLTSGNTVDLSGGFETIGYGN